MSLWNGEKQAYVCECGCGTVIDSWKSWSLGHHMRDPIQCALRHTEEINRETAERMANRIVSEETCERISKSKTGVFEDEDQTLYRAEAIREAFRKDPSIIERMSKIRTGMVFPPEHVENLRLAMMKAREEDPTIMESIAESHRRNFDSPEFCMRWAESHNREPNGPEGVLIDLLNLSFPGLFEYTGNSKVWINGRNPDFICESHKLIIESFGYYHHKIGDEEDRIQHYAKAGYRCYVIWADNMVDALWDFDKVKDWVDKNLKRFALVKI